LFQIGDPERIFVLVAPIRAGKAVRTDQFGQSWRAFAEAGSLAFCSTVTSSAFVIAERPRTPSRVASW